MSNGSENYPIQGDGVIATEIDSALSPDFLERMAHADLDGALQAQTFLREQGYELVTNTTNPRVNLRGYDETLNGYKSIKRFMHSHQEGDIAIAPAVSNPIPEADDPRYRELIRLPQDVAIFRHESATRLSRLERAARFIERIISK